MSLQQKLNKLKGVDSDIKDIPNTQEAPQNPEDQLLLKEVPFMKLQSAALISTAIKKKPKDDISLDYKKGK